LLGRLSEIISSQAYPGMGLKVQRLGYTRQNGG